MPTPTVEFELEPKLPLDVRNKALDFTDRWPGFEPDVFKAIFKLTTTPWRLTKIKVRFQSTATPEPETHEARATIQIDASATWHTPDYLRVMIRELITANMRERMRRRLKNPVDEAASHLLAESFSEQILTRLLPGSRPDLRPSLARFLSLLLPSKYPHADREAILAKAPQVRAAIEDIVGDFPADSGRYYEAFQKLSNRLSEELSKILAADL